MQVHLTVLKRNEGPGRMDLRGIMGAAQQDESAAHRRQRLMHQQQHQQQQQQVLASTTATGVEAAPAAELRTGTGEISILFWFFSLHF